MNCKLVSASYIGQVAWNMYFRIIFSCGNRACQHKEKYVTRDLFREVYLRLLSV